MSAFGQALKRMREEKDWTREQLAEKCGLSRMQIFRLETGEQGASWETVQALAAALGVDCTAFQADDDDSTGKKKPARKRRPKK